jgi:hypothetical protein
MYSVWLRYVVALCDGEHVISVCGNKASSLSPHLFYLLTVGVEVFVFSLDHSQTHTTVGGTPLDEGSAGHRDFYLTTQTLTRQTSMPPVGFEPTIPASARPQTARPLGSVGNKVLGENFGPVND